MLQCSEGFSSLRWVVPWCRSLLISVSRRLARIRVRKVLSPVIPRFQWSSVRAVAIVRQAVMSREFGSSKPTPHTDVLAAQLVRSDYTTPQALTP